MLLAGLAGPASGAASHQVERYHVDFGTLAEAEPHCADEPIRWTGGYDLVIIKTTTTTGTTRSLNYEQTLDGVGLESGAAYRLEAHYHELNRSSVAGAQVVVMPNSYVQVSRDGRPNYTAQRVSISVYDANGTIVVDYTEDGPGFIRCVG